jgi:hypothetical protein
LQKAAKSPQHTENTGVELAGRLLAARRSALSTKSRGGVGDLGHVNVLELETGTEELGGNALYGATSVVTVIPYFTI